jgi:hypothetical protein
MSKSKSKTKQAEAPESTEAPKVTHDCTEAVRQAIEEHGNPLLKHLNKDGDFVRYFHYRKNGVQGFGNGVFVNGRRISSLAKGILFLSGNATDHLKELSEALSATLNRSVMEILMKDLESVGNPQNTRKVLLQVLNKAITEGINDAMISSGGEPFEFETTYETSGDRDGRAFVQVVYDGFAPTEEQIETMHQNMRAQKARRSMAEAATGVDATSADYTS